MFLNHKTMLQYVNEVLLSDESSTKVSESYQEHPNEMKQRGGSRG